MLAPQPLTDDAMRVSPSSSSSLSAFAAVHHPAAGPSRRPQSQRPAEMADMQLSSSSSSSSSSSFCSLALLDRLTEEDNRWIQRWPTAVYHSPATTSSVDRSDTSSVNRGHPPRSPSSPALSTTTSSFSISFNRDNPTASAATRATPPSTISEAHFGDGDRSLPFIERAGWGQLASRRASEGEMETRLAALSF